MRSKSRGWALEYETKSVAGNKYAYREDDKDASTETLSGHGGRREPLSDNGI